MDILFTATDYAVVMKYNGRQALHGYTHVAKLISPAIRPTTDQCMQVTLIAVSNFTIKVAHLDPSLKYTEVSHQGNSTG